MTLLFNFIDDMYVVEYVLQAIEPGKQGIKTSDVFKEAFDFHKFVTIGLILTWCSIVSVKLSYLLLFKKLVDRLPRMIAYWWFVAAFNAIISVYGAVVYIAVCPQFHSLKACECILREVREYPSSCLTLDLVGCAMGKGVQRTMALSISQMVMDITGDLLSACNWCISTSYSWLTSYQSTVHSLPVDLESRGQVDSESRIVVISLSRSLDHRMYHNSHSRNPYWPARQVHRINLGNILAVHYGESGIDHDRSHRIF